MYVRYERQARLVDQRRLERAKAAVMGMGGLGNFVAMELALAGVGHIYVVDRDRVEETNLNRQFLFRDEDIGRPKAEVAAERLREINPKVRITPVRGDAKHLDLDVDLIFDCLDVWEEKQALWKKEIPVVFGSIGGWIGMVGIFIEKHPKFVARPATDVLGASAGIVGSLMAQEGIKELSGQKSPLRNKILHIDLRRLEFTVLEL